MCSLSPFIKTDTPNDNYFNNLPPKTKESRTSKANKSTHLYFQTYAAAAQANQAHSGVPASICLAQGFLESNQGKSYIARNANNHFGIKCHKDWQGKTLYRADDKPNECFRSYPNALDSYKAHSDFLLTNPRYNSLFALPADDYRNWAKGLSQKGYATDTAYAEKLVSIIEKYGLDDY